MSDMYHGSRHRLRHLRAGSWVTPYAEDAAVFGVPWSTNELRVARASVDGRPPQRLAFKGEPPPDHPIYVHRVHAHTEPARTNTGAEYSWNRRVTEKTPIADVTVIPSWQERFMPFRSKRQQKAMFGGHIPGMDKSDAKQWAKETDFSKLPERAPAEKGKPTLRSKKAKVDWGARLRSLKMRRDPDGIEASKQANGDMLQYFADHPEKAKAYRERKERERRKAAAAAFEKLEAMLGEVFKTAALGSAVMKSSNVGKLRGMMTTNALKAPGYAASTQAINPRRSMVSAINAIKPH